jgi:A/G-specific adenine glycosylase
VGAYTAAAIAAIAFGRQATPVDGNIERVVARLHAIETPLPAAKSEIREHAKNLTPRRRAGDFAQAMMDLGATLCAPKNPACALCPFDGACLASERGDAATFPRKTPKANGNLRRGAAFVAVREDGAVLVRRRPAAGLLGGMTEVPTTEWSSDFETSTALAGAPRFPSRRPAWRRIPGVVTHLFTHFPLELIVYKTSVPKGTRPPAGTRWSPKNGIAGEALPNVMRKVVAHAMN